jgi:DUF971 family protein
MRTGPPAPSSWDGPTAMRPPTTPEQTRLVDVALVGSYAIQATWGDGHATGYHTFMLLREMCPCPECTRAREQRHADEHQGHGGNR